MSLSGCKSALCSLIRISTLLALLAACTVNPETETAELKSEFLEQAEYYPATRVLTLHFTDGSIYTYQDIPRSVFTELRDTNSAGDYFNQHVRNEFKYRRLKAGTSRTPKDYQTAKPVEVECPKLDSLQLDSLPKRSVVSEVLDYVSYDSKTDCLVLYFDRGQVYRYDKVPDEIYQGLITSERAGRYFNERVWGKKKHTYEQLK